MRMGMPIIRSPITWVGEGDLELHFMVPESFRTDVLKESLDDNSVLVESANVETANFALLFEFDGDVKKIRHVLYNCVHAHVLNIESTTNEEEIEVQTETLAITAAPLANGYCGPVPGTAPRTLAVYAGAVYAGEPGQRWFIRIPSGRSSPVSRGQMMRQEGKPYEHETEYHD